MKPGKIGRMPRGKPKGKPKSKNFGSRDGGADRAFDKSRGQKTDWRGSKDSGRSGSFSGGSRNAGSVQMHRAVCDKCDSPCQVPFKPLGNKPVLCSDCFERKLDGGGSSHSSSDETGRQLDEINRKLDRIMRALKLER